MKKNKLNEIENFSYKVINIFSFYFFSSEYEEDIDDVEEIEIQSVDKEISRGKLLGDDLNPDKFFIMPKDGAFHIFYDKDARVYINSDVWEGEIKIYPNPLKPTSSDHGKFTKLQCKHWQFLDTLCGELTKAVNVCSEVPVKVAIYGDREGINKWGNFFPFLKVYTNDTGDKCVLVELDGEEKLFPLTDIINKKFKISAIIKVGAIKPNLKQKQHVVSLTVEELKLSSRLTKQSVQKPELRFAHFIKF